MSKQFTDGTQKGFYILLRIILLFFSPFRETAGALILSNILWPVFISSESYRLYIFFPFQKRKTLHSRTRVRLLRVISPAALAEGLTKINFQNDFLYRAYVRMLRDGCL